MSVYDHEITNKVHLRDIAVTSTHQSFAYHRGLKLISACGPRWKITFSRRAAPQTAIVLRNTVLTTVES